MVSKLLSPALLLGALIAAGCASPTGREAPPRPDGTTVPLYEGMGPHRRTITTDSEDAQRYFDQALTWTYAFNHDEAIRSYERVAELDPNCAMAWWGIALCHGPHINNPMMPEERSAAAWDALQKARVRMNGASPVERALIEALSTRYANPWPEDRGELDRAYADAMAEVWAKYPDDSDVGTLYAESLMDLHPWDLYTQDREPREGTEEIVALLEHVREMDPTNPGAHHLFIHAVEPSNDPARGLPAADALRDMVPASGHLTHMPSHIDVLVGQWEKAIEQNEKAMRADRAYRETEETPSFQNLYMSHNSHMLAFAAMMSGRERDALAAAQAIWEDVPRDALREGAAFLDPMMIAVWDVQKRFGRWDDILASTPPPNFLPISNAMWRANRAIAFAAKGQVDSARREQEKFRELRDALPEDRPMVISPARSVLGVADHVVSAEIAIREEDMATAADELRKAIELEDGLHYMEPPEWIQPTRHTLGAVLLVMGDYAGAEAVYREDLEKWPNNGWSLYGLGRALRGQGKDDEADTAEAAYRRSWARADAPTETSCKCIPRT